MNNGQQIVRDAFFHEHAIHLLLEQKDIMGRQQRLELLGRVKRLRTVEDLFLLLRRGIANAQPHEEPIELRLRKGNVPWYSAGFCVAMTMKG